VVIVSKPTRLGLDLQGGVSLVYQAKPTKQAQVNSESIERAIDIMRKRVDQLGVAEPEIQRSGQDQIDVSLPDVENADEAAEPGRHHRAALLLRLGEERPGAGLQARPDRPERDRRAGRGQRGRRPQPL
jgi:preprotein translocase subunit SecD